MTIKNIFKKEYKPNSDKESVIKAIIENIVQKDDTEVRIDPSNGNIFISKSENHYDIVLLHSSIIITNSTFCLRESFSIDFIDSLKTIANKRASEDRKRVLEGILSREKEMLNNIEKSL